MLETFTVPTVHGPLRAAVTEFGLLQTALPGSAFDLGAAVALAGEPRRVTTHPLAPQLAEYVAGRRKAFDLTLDLRLVTSEFRRSVLEALFEVPYGELVTYGELAARVGRPGGARAVGGAVGANPLAPVIPCHRVIASGGRIGGFSCGLPLKRWLLEIEGVTQFGSTAAA